MTILADGNDVTQISTTMAKWVDGFTYGAAFSAGANSINALTGDNGKWDILRTGDMSVTLNNGNLTVGMGLTSGSELLLVARHNATIPQDFVLSLSMSQRIAGNVLRFGYLAIDRNTGLPLPHPTLSGSFAEFAGIRLDGATSTTAVAETMEGGQPTIRNTSMTLAASSSTLQDYAIECRPTDATFASQVTDTAAIRGGGSGRLSSVVPNPNYLYRPFIWLRNNSAPASSTTVVFSRIVSMDIQELQAEIGGGRGNLAGSQAIPVAVVSGGNSLAITNMVVASSANGTSTHKLISAATTNAVTVKATPGRIVAGSIANLSGNTAYLKLFNKASAPVPGTDVPFLTIPLFAGQTNMLAILADAIGVYCSAGISYAITAGVADLDTTAIGAGDVVVALVTA